MKSKPTPSTRVPPPPRKYDAGDRREKAEEMKRLAEMKRQRELAAAGKPLPRAMARPGDAKGPAEVLPGPKDPRFEGRAAKAAEQKALAAKRANDLLFGVRMKAAEHSRWKQQAEAQEQTVSSRLQDLFGKGPPKKPSREQAARRRKG